MYPSKISDLVQKEYLNNNKILLTLFTLNSLMLLASCIIGIVWLTNISNEYTFLSGFEDFIMVFLYITILGVFLSLVGRLNSRINKNFLGVWFIILIISFNCLNLLLLLVWYSASNYDQCGYFVSYHGEFQEISSADYLKYQYGKAWCYPPENSELSVKEYMYARCVTFITDSCSKKYTDQALSDCIDQSSLSLNDESTVLPPIKACFYMMLVGCFFFFVFSLALTSRLAKASKTVFERQGKAELENQSNSQKQYLIVSSQADKSVAQVSNQQYYQPPNTYFTSINQE